MAKRNANRKIATPASIAVLIGAIMTAGQASAQTFNESDGAVSALKLPDIAEIHFFTDGSLKLVLESGEVMNISAEMVEMRDDVPFIAVEALEGFEATARAIVPADDASELGGESGAGTLIAGVGSGTFVEAPRSAADTIADFPVTEDVVDVTGQDLTATEALPRAVDDGHGNTVIDLVTDVFAADLTEDNFGGKDTVALSTSSEFTPLSTTSFSEPVATSSDTVFSTDAGSFGFEDGSDASAAAAMAFSDMNEVA